MKTRNFQSIRESIISENNKNYRSQLFFLEDERESTRELVKEILSSLMSSRASYIIEAAKTSVNGRSNFACHNGVTYELSENGMCSVCDIDSTLLKLRVPQAIVVDGRHYLVTMLRPWSEIDGLRHLELPDWTLYLILPFPDLESVEFYAGGIFTTIDGAVFRLENNIPVELKWFPPHYSEGQFHLPNSMKDIADYAFQNCKTIPLFIGGSGYWQERHLLPTRCKNYMRCQTGDGKIFVETKPQTKSDYHYHHIFVLKHIPTHVKTLVLHRYLDPSENGLYRLVGIDLDSVSESVNEIQLYGWDRIPDDFIRDTSCLPNLRRIVCKKQMGSNIGGVFSFLLHPIDSVWKKPEYTEDTREYLDEAISYLLSTFMPYVIIAKRRGDEAHVNGMIFKLYENGACFISGVDANTTHIRIPQAILVDGRYYLVRSFNASSKNLKSIHISNTLSEIYLYEVPYLETVTCDEHGHFKVIDEVLYGVESDTGIPHTLTWFPRNYPHKEFALPDSLTDIGRSAFDNCQNIPEFTGGAEYWKRNDCISLPNQCRATQDGNIYKVVADFTIDDELYQHVLLNKIARGKKSITLYPFVDMEKHDRFRGIDLDDVYESVTEIRLHGIKSIPENFIRRKSCLPNLERIVFEKDEDMSVRIPDLIYHKEVIYRPINKDRTEVATYGPTDNEDGNVKDGTLSIPSEFSDGDNTYKVTAIGEESFRNCSFLQNVIIPPTVRIIEEGAFYECRFLESVKIPSSVVEIGKRAFSYCQVLKEIDIPDSVKTIGKDAFHKWQDPSQTK